MSDFEFERTAAENIRTLRTGLTIVCVGLVLTLGLGAWGFVRAGDANSTANGIARVADGAAVQAQQAASGVSADEVAIAADEAATHANAIRSCQLQSAGLSAQPYLRGALNDIHLLLTVPLTRAQRRAQRHEPRSVRAIVRTLDRNLSAYVRITSPQPRGRAC